MGLCVGKGFKRYIGSGFLEGFKKKSKRSERKKQKLWSFSYTQIPMGYMLGCSPALLVSLEIFILFV